jgi:cold shock protein
MLAAPAIYTYQANGACRFRFTRSFMIKGTVKFFNGTKGFGFITPDDGSKEVFVPSATVTSSGAGLLKAGQRVSFEAEQETKGPKAVKLTLLDEPVKELPKEPAREQARELAREPSREALRPAITLYQESDCEDAADVMAALAEAGHSARQVDYILTPPPREELKRLSLLLREASQSLARRYEPLFMELQLDDRFLSESEFLTAIFEHPSLINGPILATSGKARICRTAEDVQAFLGNGVVEEKRPKGLSPRMAAMMLGHAVPPAPPVVEKETQKAEAPAKPAASAKPQADIEPAAKAKVVLKPRKTVAAAVPVNKPAATKAPAKPVKAVKVKAAAKPAKKTKK